MGGNQSIVYSVPITEKPEGQTAIYRSPQYKNGLVDSPAENLKTMKDILLNSKKTYGNLNALGRIVKDGDKSKIQYTNYNQFIDEAHAVGSGIINSHFYNTDQQNHLNFVGIFSKNRPEWSIVDAGCVLFKLTTIPIYDTLGDQNITYVLKHCGLKCCFVNDGGLKALKKTQDLDQLKFLVSFDPLEADSIKYFEQKGIKLISYNDLVAEGKQKKVDYNAPEYKVEPKDCLTFSYTSGTTGPPKGAMISQNNFASFCAAAANCKDTGFNKNDVALSYLPLPHILERQFLFSMFYAGGTIVYYSGDVMKLNDDLALVQPTVFVSVPKLYSRFYDVIQAKFKLVQGYTKTALDYALQSKLSTVQSTGQFTHRVYDPLFFNKTKQALGGKCRLMISGSAPLLPDVQNFLKVCISAPILEGYGQTQNTGAAFITQASDPQVRHVGGPVSSFQFKLVDIPQMKYLSTDKNEEGKETPRGEIWLRGPGVFLGYYKDVQKTKQAVTQDGWLKTGDVGMLLPNTRGLKIIDRKKNIFKLQQGQYVAAEKVQNIYAKCDLLAEVFIHGQSTQSFAIVIAVPHKKAVMQIAQSKKFQGTFQQLCQKKQIRSEILTKLNHLGKQAGLKGFEQARNIFLQPAGFMLKGILTNTMKIQRHQAKKVYREVVDDLYKQGMIPLGK